MRRARVFAALLTILLTWLLPGAVMAGRNAGGALIVHTQDVYVFSAGTVCTTTYSTPASCEEAVTRSDKDVGTVVWLLAAFPDTSNPSVSGIYFGIDYHDSLSMDAWKMCAPAGSQELPDTRWPYEGRGNSIAFGTPVVGNRLFPFYAFKIDGGTDGSFFSSTANPTGGYAAFIDDGFPPIVDEITQFGTVRWYAAGSNQCPAQTDDPVGPDGPDWSESLEEARAVALDGFTGAYATASTFERIPCWWINDGVVPPQVQQNCEYGTIRSSLLCPNPGVTLTYFFSRTWEPPWDPILNLPMALDSRTDSLSGYHNHNNPVRREADPSHFQGNSGPSGYGFSVTHYWWEDAREVNLFVYSTDPNQPYGSASSPAFKYCVRQGSYVELPDQPSLYQKIGLESNRHLRQHHYGSQPMVNALTTLATKFRELSPDTLLTRAPTPYRRVKK